MIWAGVTFWALMVAPGYTDYDVEVLAVYVTSFYTLDECQDVAKSDYVDEHAWCEPIKVDE